MVSGRAPGGPHLETNVFPATRRLGREAKHTFRLLRAQARPRSAVVWLRGWRFPNRPRPPGQDPRPPDLGAMSRRVRWHSTDPRHLDGEGRRTPRGSAAAQTGRGRAGAGGRPRAPRDLRCRARSSLRASIPAAGGPAGIGAAFGALPRPTPPDCRCWQAWRPDAQAAGHLTGFALPHAATECPANPLI